MSVSFDDMVEL